MSTNASEIKRVLKGIFSDHGKSDNRNVFYTAEVLSVGSETCDVEIGGTVYTGVHLSAVSDGNANNLVVTPAVGSVVLICDKSGGDMVWMNVVSFSEIAALRFRADGFECVVEGGKVSIWKGIYSLADVLSELLEAIKAITVTTGVGPSGTPVNFAKFDEVQKKLNNFIK